MFGLFNQKKNEEAMQLVHQALGPNVIAIVSASCCMSGVAAMDEQIKQAATQALQKAGLDWPVLLVTVTEAREVLSRVSGKLGEQAGAVAAQVSELFVSSGLSAFPVLIANQQVVSYGGVPGVDLIVKHLPVSEKASLSEAAR